MEPPSGKGSDGDTDSRILLVAGPTAAGKSALALELAAQLSGEIISADSMQVYRGMEIGTAKPTAEDRRQVPHHLIDVAELSESFDAARFVRMAEQAIGEIRSRGKLPIVCGGTGFYLKAWMEGLGEAPAANSQLRAELSGIPLIDLLKELERCDPATYDKIDRQNPRRVIRAVEVIRLTGKPFSMQRAAWKQPPESLPEQTAGRQNVICLGISRPPGELRERINQRVDRMFEEGLVKETEQLLAHGLATNPTAMQALGYRQVAEYLNGVRPLNETIELVKIRTRQFAKRQMTWFKRQMRLDWISLAGDVDVCAMVRQRMR